MVAEKKVRDSKHKKDLALTGLRMKGIVVRNMGGLYDSPLGNRDLSPVAAWN